MAHNEALLRLVDSKTAMFVSNEEFRVIREQGMHTWREIIRESDPRKNTVPMARSDFQLTENIIFPMIPCCKMPISYKITYATDPWINRNPDLFAGKCPSRNSRGAY